MTHGASEDTICRSCTNLVKNFWLTQRQPPYNQIENPVISILGKMTKYILFWKLFYFESHCFMSYHHGDITHILGLLHITV